MSENSDNAGYAVTQEVRIASVMFGGVSLAVYMNGITQELLSAVRATAPAAPRVDKEWQTGDWSLRRNSKPLLDDPLKSTDAIYRILGRSLFHGRVAGTPLAVSGPIRTRIVIDLLAGTSAGGINSVYLAKALVNNQDLDQLKEMWMDQADIDTLLNDGSSDPATYPPGPKTTSLLNSTRMYGLLYRAFEDMDKKPAGSPLSDELDLFVTTTDLDGVATPIQLADRMIEERVHKASFHFVYGPGRPGSPNDFTKTYNPMLAFASRCTSSFPIAFEPMALGHIDRLLPGLALTIQQDANHPLRKFFAQFECYNPGLSFVRRPLADGGYLNNKPFSFVVDQVKLRTGTVPVSRKLLFLDPFPELNSQVRHTKQDIDFAENALDAGSTLPRYQTIREDIERLNEYNRDVHGAQLLAREIEEESPTNVARDYAVGLNPVAYPERTLGDLESQFGVCYRTYHRLRVSAVTTELASLVTRLLGQNDRSDALLAIRMLIHSWRRENYSPKKEEGKALETFFLFQYDLGFRYRRAEYVRGRIDDLLAALAGADANAEARLNNLLRAVLPKEDVADAVTRLLGAKDEGTLELRRLRDRIEYVKWRLATERERMYIGTARGGLDEKTHERCTALVQTLGATQLTPDDLGWILTPVQDDECQQRADFLYEKGERQVFDIGPRTAYSSQPGTPSGPRPVKRFVGEAARLLAEWYSEVVDALSKTFTEQVRRQPDFIQSAAGIVNEYVWIYYQYFDLRDMQVFTVMQDQLAGEGSPVEIYRVSPLDAILLRTNSDPTGEDKLAGDALFAFGAFLSKSWRSNDMMWGRLDGAERIIGALLPDESDGCLRRQLCEQAFEIIVKEEFTPSRCADLVRPLMDYLRQRIGTAGKTADQFLAEALSDSEANCPEVIRQLLKSISASAERLAVFRAYYVKPADPPIKESLDRLRRALRIFGDMLKELDGGNGPFTSVGGGIARFGSALTRFAEFCVPQSMPNVFFRYALQLLYAIALILIVTGGLFYKEAETAGWVVLGVTVTANIAAWMVAKWLFRQRTGRKLAAALAASVLLLAAFATLLVRFECELPAGAWKAPVHAIAHLLDSRCAARK